MSSADDMPDIVGPLQVAYCGVCGFPPEYCEFTGKNWKTACSPWLLENMDRDFLEKYELISKADEELAEGLQAASLDEADGDEKKKGEKTTKKGEAPGKGDKLMPGGKVKKKDAKCITVERLQRNKRKFTTVITGLEHFNVKLKDAAKIFKKKFSCGCAEVKGKAGQADTVEIQGDFLDEVLEMLAESKDFDDVPEEALFIKEGAKKKSYV